MESTVQFRPFKVSDVDFIYKLKNDRQLNSMIVKEWHPFSYSESQNWVKGWMVDNPKFKAWVITPLNSDDAIGYCSLVSIDNYNKSAETGAIVISDKNYNDGFAWIEGVRYLFEYAFETLELNRVYGVSLVGHKMSNIIGDLMFMTVEGTLREAAFRNGQFYDLQYVGILKNEYFSHKKAGEYDMQSVIRRLRRLLKNKKNKNI